MCGILTYFTKGKVSENMMSDFIDSLQLVSHRGPDTSGLILINTKNGQCKSFFGSKIEYSNVDLSKNYNMIIGHKRLKVIDISDNGALFVIVAESAALFTDRGVSCTIVKGPGEIS